MGVPKLQSRYVNPILAIGGAPSQNAPTDTSSLYIDATAVIYSVVASVCGYGERYDVTAFTEASRLSKVPSNTEGMTELDMKIVVGTVESLQKYYTTYSPSHLFFAAFDGRVPSAKMNQQRTRRWLSSNRKLNITPEALAADRSVQAQLLFDTNSITPGTRFMEVLDSYIMSSFPSGKIGIGSTVFLYSSYRDEGEGEHKIMKLMRSEAVVPVGSHIIVSSDSDMILLASTLELDNVHVFREQLDTWVSIKQLKYNLKNAYSVNAKNDVILLLQLLGNDFLPPQAAFLPGPEGQVMPSIRNKRVSTKDLPLPLLDAYKNEKGNFIEFDEFGRVVIDWSAYRGFLSIVAKREYDLLSQIAPYAEKEDPRWSNEIFTLKNRGSDVYEDFRAAWYERALPDVKVEERPKIIKKMVRDYLLALAWCCVYYFEENTASSNSVYGYRYAPLLSDIVAFEWEGGYESEVRVSLDQYEEELPTLPEQFVSVVPQHTSEDGFGLFQAVHEKEFPLPINIEIDTLGLTVLDRNDAEIVAVRNLPVMNTSLVRELQDRDDEDSVLVSTLMKATIESHQKRYEEVPTLVLERKALAKKPEVRKRETKKSEEIEEIAEPSAKKTSKPAARPETKTPVKAPAKVAPKAPPKAPVKVPAKK